MTAVAGPGVGVHRPERRRRWAAWVLAARLARREVRRRKGRTALVVALIAIPVIAMTIASVVFRTTRDTPADNYARQFGGSDMALWLNGGSNRGIQELRDRLPEGTREVVVNEIFDSVRPADGRSPAYVRFSGLPLDDPITDGIVRVTTGRVPTTGADEVLLSPDVARILGVGVGDVLHLEVPAVSYLVVGLGQATASLDDPLMVPGSFDFSTVKASSLGSFELIDLPEGVSPESLGIGSQSRGDVATRSNWGGYQATGAVMIWGSSSSVAVVVWGWVAGVLALSVMGIVVAAAFAVSARRQLVTLGQLSANGADRWLLRGTLALQGAWCGLIGVAVGIVVGLGLVVPQHGLLERLADRSLRPIALAPPDLLLIAVTGVVAATVAAFVPARASTRVSVASALAGRRPLGAVPRWLAPVGAVLFAGGLGLIALSALDAQTGDRAGPHRNLFAGVAVLGGLGLLFGMCCVTPAITAGFGVLAGRVRGTARLAGRSLSRVRTRTAAVLAAIAAAGALAIGGGTAVASTWRVDDGLTASVPYLAENMVVLVAYDHGGSYGVSTDGDDTTTQVVTESVPPASTPGAELYDPPRPEVTPVPPDIEARIAAVIPDAEVIPIRIATFDPPPQPPVGPTLRGPRFWYLARFVVADPALLDAMEVSSADRQTLARVGVLEGFQSDEGGAERTVIAPTQDGSLTFTVAPMRDRPAMWAYAQSALITPAKAAELGLEVGRSETLYVTPRPLTDERRVQLRSATDLLGLPGSAFDAALPPATGGVGYGVNIGSGMGREITRSQVDGLIVIGALLYILGVVAVGLALSAAESRDERDVLLAVGASPRAMRRVAAQKAALLASVGGILALPTGFLPAAVVIARSNDDAIRFPWLVALGCVLIVPAVVAAATYVGSAIAQRARPIAMSNMVTD